MSALMESPWLWIGLGLLVVLGLLGIWALCRAAAMADRAKERMRREDRTDSDS